MPIVSDFVNKAFYGKQPTPKQEPSRTIGNKDWQRAGQRPFKKPAQPLGDQIGRPQPPTYQPPEAPFHAPNSGVGRARNNFRRAGGATIPQFGQGHGVGDPRGGSAPGVKPAPPPPPIQTPHTDYTDGGRYPAPGGAARLPEEEKRRQMNLIKYGQQSGHPYPGFTNDEFFQKPSIERT